MEVDDITTFYTFFREVIRGYLKKMDYTNIYESPIDGLDLLNYFAVAIHENFSKANFSESSLETIISTLKQGIESSVNDPLRCLTKREREFLVLHANSKTTQEILKIMNVSRVTACRYKRNILNKLNADSMLEGIVKAFNVKID